MSRRSTIRSRSAAAVLVLLGLVVGPVQAVAGSRDAACGSETPGDYTTVVEQWSQAVSGPPTPEGVVDVPVTLFLMEAEMDRTDVRSVWTAAMVERHFGPSGAYPVNAVWEKAHIRFVLAGVRLCAATSEDVGAPYGSPEFERKFKAVARLGARRQITIFLWHSIAVEGIGRSLRSAPHAAVWLDRKCAQQQPPASCQVLIAHELGHALGINHICVESTGEPEFGKPSLCGFTVTECFMDTDAIGSLMRATMKGRELCGGEKEAARAGARTLLSER